MENSIVFCLMLRVDFIEEKNFNVVCFFVLVNYILLFVSEYEDKSI